MPPKRSTSMPLLHQQLTDTSQWVNHITLLSTAKFLKAPTCRLHDVALAWSQFTAHSLLPLRDLSFSSQGLCLALSVQLYSFFLPKAPSLIYVVSASNVKSTHLFREAPSFTPPFTPFIFFIIQVPVLNYLFARVLSLVPQQTARQLYKHSQLVFIFLSKIQNKQGALYS